MTHRAYTIGIIAGSGPEAGIDLWTKVLTATQQQLGAAFEGDIDAPRVVIVSEPQLGLSMDLRANEAATWDALARTVCQIAPQVDVFVIACNTLNWFAPRIETLIETLIETVPNAGQFLSFQTVLRSAITRSGQTQIGLLAAGPVAALDDFSVYTALACELDFEVPKQNGEQCSHQRNELHSLIEDVKRYGQGHAGLRERFETIAQSLAARCVVLACTELPLIATPVAGKTFIDVTECVANTLAARAINARETQV